MGRAFITLALAITMGCGGSVETPAPPKSVVVGRATKLEGSWPYPGRVSPYEGDIYFYSVMPQCTQRVGVRRQLLDAPVAHVRSDGDGWFSADVPRGHYVVFAEWDGFLVPWSWTSEGCEHSALDVRGDVVLLPEDFLQINLYAD